MVPKRKRNMARRMTEAEILLNKQCQYLESLGFFIAHAYGNRIRVSSDSTVGVSQVS